MSGRAFAGLVLGLVACGSVPPAPPRPLTATVVDAPYVPEITAVPDTATPHAPAVAHAAENRISFYGLSLDLSDAWRDETNYEFRARQETIQHVSFEPSDLQPAQVRAWLEEVRQRFDGAYGAKPSVVELYENPNFVALGLRISFKPKFLYDVFVTLDDRVMGISVKCRADCDATVRGIVRSLSKPEAATAPGGAKGTPHRYSVRGMVFDSAQAFELPRELMLMPEDPVDRTPERRVYCSRTSSPPADETLPSEINSSNAVSEALAKAPRVEETLNGKPNDASKALPVRLYHREGYVTDELGEKMLASSTSAVMAVGGDAFTCHLRAARSSRELVARFRRLVESARRE